MACTVPEHPAAVALVELRPEQGDQCLPSVDRDRVRCGETGEERHPFRVAQRLADGRSVLHSEIDPAQGAELEHDSLVAGIPIGSRTPGG